MGDIEKQTDHIPQSHGDENDIQRVESTKDENYGEISLARESAPSPTVAAAASTTNSTAPPSCTSMLKKSLIVAVQSIVIVVLILLGLPFLGIVVIVGALFNGNPFDITKGREGIYKKIRDFESTAEKTEDINVVAATWFGILTLIWLAVNLVVPSLKSVTFLGSSLWKWSFLVVIMSLGYTIAVTIVFAFFTAVVEISKLIGRRNVEYFLYGLMPRISSIVHFSSVLLVWQLYFRTERGFEPSSRAAHFGTWTFVSLLVGAILWAIKSALRLHWEANAIYRRFKARILTAGFRLYFLQLVLDKWQQPFLIDWREQADKPLAAMDVVSQNVDLDDIRTVAIRLMGLAQAHLRGSDSVPEIVSKCREMIPPDRGPLQVTEEDLHKNFNLGKNDAQLLLEELQTENLTQEIKYDTFQKWMVDAHKSCLSLGYTLIDAREVVSCLNKVLIFSVIIVVIFLWLLLTELATTKIVVLIATSSVSLTFVFGDTCKTFFQGVVFSFVNHPFDVGDRCIIDDIELEVKNIGILTATFVKIGTNEKTLYPTSDLATKRIINLKGEPDPNDVIELLLDSSTKESQILDLQERIKCFLDNDEHRGLYEKSHEVMVKEITNNIRINIHFKHVMNVQDVTHSQYLLKKNKQRSAFLIKTKRFLEDKDIKVAT